jgi:hypothetical protein
MSDAQNPHVIERTKVQPLICLLRNWLTACLNGSQPAESAPDLGIDPSSHRFASRRTPHSHLLYL